MRKLMFVLFIFICVVGKSQNDLPYKSLSVFSGDTTAFMIYNFMDRADYYKGLTLKEVSRDLKIPIKYLVETSDGNKESIIGLIYIYDEKKVSHLFEDKNVSFYCLKIYWDEEALIKKRKINRLNNIDAKYEALKDYKIKKIEVVLSRDYKDYEKYFPQRKTKSSEDKENKELIYRWSTRRK